MRSLNKTIVITGATSFVGMHLCKAFAKSDWRVIAGHTQDLIEYSGPQATRISQISSFVKFEKFDICDASALTNIVDKYSPRIWVQQAGYTSDYSNANYDFSMGLNVNAGSIPILFKTLKDQNCGVIITGSEVEYGPSEGAVAESNTPQPNSLYGIAKLTQTITAQQQSVYYGVPTRVVRLFLPFGSFDNPGKLIPLVIEALKNSKSIDLSPCTQRRDLIGIKDVCSAYLKLADDLNRGGFDLFNICSGDAIELRAFLKLIAIALEADQKLLKFGRVTMRVGETNLIMGDNSKAMKLLAWHPRELAIALNEDFSLVT